MSTATYHSLGAPHTTLTLTKLEAAKRQLVVAIWLWFKDVDLASVHTLTAAAFGILRDLFHHRKMGQPLLFDEKFMPKGAEKVIRDFLKHDEAFLKHARKDPEATHELFSNTTEMSLLAAVKAYGDLTGKPEENHGLMTVFVFWFAMTQPELFDDLPPLTLKSGNVDELRKLSKTEYFAVAGGPFADTPPIL